MVNTVENVNKLMVLRGSLHGSAEETTPLDLSELNETLVSPVLEEVSHDHDQLHHSLGTRYNLVAMTHLEITSLDRLLQTRETPVSQLNLQSC